MELVHITSFSALYLHLITILLIMSLFHPTPFVKSLGNDTDRLALLKFKDAIATDPHGVLNSWNDSVPFCSWHGITCSTRHQRVTALNLTGYDLPGTISPYIGNLSFLGYFNLAVNNFSGMIPQQVDHLSRLRYFDLSNNVLEGEIPANLSFCRELTTIDLSYNRLIGQIRPELGTLMKLENLFLFTNQLTGVIPPSLANLSSLTEMSFTVNHLVGNVPEEIGRMQSLVYLYLSANQLSGTIPSSIYNKSSLVEISLSINNFNGTIPPTAFLNMPSLTLLFLGVNQFSGKIPSSLSNSTQLETFDIVGNRFVGQIPRSIGNLHNLYWLGVGNNSLGSSSPNDLDFITSLTNCSKLQFLDFSFNNFGGLLPNSIANLSTNLTYLYLENNQIWGKIPETYSNLNVIILMMNSNLLTGVIPTSFGNFPKLQALDLGDNRLSGTIPSSIGNLSQLYSLSFVSNQLGGEIPPIIGNCTSLQRLNFAENRLSGGIPPQLIGLSSLTSYFMLSKNLLTGSLPVQVGKLKTLSYLDISENNLTGEIPKEIGDCENLERLHLRGNLFRGIIPSSLASLKNIHEIDLSQNNLSGQIPVDLQTRPLLRYLNLSFNNLEGEVPKEGVFQNTSAMSLVGNTKLCGGVTELQLPSCPVKVPEKRKVDHRFKLKLTVSLAVGCSILFALFALYWRRKQKKSVFAVSTLNFDFLSKVSYHALHRATGGFSTTALIGSGGFGSVYKGILDQEENNVVAVKVFNLQQRGASKSFMVECDALRNIRHRNLVKIITCCSSTDHSGNEFKALVFEYMSNGSLEEWLHRENQSGSLNLLQRLTIALDVASALCYLHDHCEQLIIHRDLKPSNILLDEDMVARVSDFGLARLIIDSSENQSSTIGIKGTIGYAPPEYAVGAEPSKQGDVYSYGILVLHMFTGRRPTDEIFQDDLNLHNFVKTALPERLVQIVDPALLATLEETTVATTENEVTNRRAHNNEIEAQEQTANAEESTSKMNAYLWNCIFPILKIGLACSQESPRERMSMEDVLKDLNHVQKAYISVETPRDRPRRS